MKGWTLFWIVIGIGEHKARSGWCISISQAQGTRPKEVDSSRIEGVDSIWIVNSYRKGGAMSLASSVGLA